MTTAPLVDQQGRSRTVMITEIAAAAILQLALSRALAKAVTVATTRETAELAGSSTRG
jgi:hypothetical protein